MAPRLKKCPGKVRSLLSCKDAMSCQIELGIKASEAGGCSYFGIEILTVTKVDILARAFKRRS